MTRSPEEVEELVQKGWDLYRRDARVKKSVDLYAAGFAFGQLQLSVVKDGNVQTLPVVVSMDLMREIGVNLYVAGVAEGQIQVSESAVHLSRGGGCKFEYFTEPRSPERGGLWPVAVNYGAVTSPQGMLVAQQSQIDLMSPLFVPPSLLDTDTARGINGGQITDELVVYMRRVRDMKFQFEVGIRNCLKGQASIVAEDWEPEFYPAVRGQSGLLAMGSVYRVFENERVDLVNLKDAAVGLLSVQQQLGAISLSTAQAVRSSFGF